MKNDLSNISPTQPFDKQLAIAVDLDNVNKTTEEVAEIIAVEKVITYYACYKCTKKVEPSSNHNGLLLGSCQSCRSGKQKLKASQLKRIAYVMFQIKHEQVLLTLFHNTLEIIFTTLKANLNSMPEEEVIDALLAIPPVQLCFDKKRKVVKSIKFT